MSKKNTLRINALHEYGSRVNALYARGALRGAVVEFHSLARRALANDGRH